MLTTTRRIQYTMEEMRKLNRAELFTSDMKLRLIPGMTMIAQAQAEALAASYEQRFAASSAASSAAPPGPKGSLPPSRGRGRGGPGFRGGRGAGYRGARSGFYDDRYGGRSPPPAGVEDGDSLEGATVGSFGGGDLRRSASPHRYHQQQWPASRDGDEGQQQGREERLVRAPQEYLRTTDWKRPPNLGGTAGPTQLGGALEPVPEWAQEDGVPLEPSQQQAQETVQQQPREYRREEESMDSMFASEAARTAGTIPSAQPSTAMAFATAPMRATSPMGVSLLQAHASPEQSSGLSTETPEVHQSQFPKMEASTEGIQAHLQAHLMAISQQHQQTHGHPFSSGQQPLPFPVSFARSVLAVPAAGPIPESEPTVPSKTAQEAPRQQTNEEVEDADIALLQQALLAPPTPLLSASKVASQTVPASSASTAASSLPSLSLQQETAIPAAPRSEEGQEPAKSETTLGQGTAAEKKQKLQIRQPSPQSKQPVKLHIRKKQPQEQAQHEPQPQESQPSEPAQQPKSGRRKGKKAKEVGGTQRKEQVSVGESVSVEAPLNAAQLAAPVPPGTLNLTWLGSGSSAAPQSRAASGFGSIGDEEEKRRRVELEAKALAERYAVMAAARASETQGRKTWNIPDPAVIYASDSTPKLSLADIQQQELAAKAKASDELTRGAERSKVRDSESSKEQAQAISCAPSIPPSPPSAPCPATSSVAPAPVPVPVPPPTSSARHSKKEKKQNHQKSPESSSSEEIFWDAVGQQPESPILSPPLPVVVPVQQLVQSQSTVPATVSQAAAKTKAANVWSVAPSPKTPPLTSIVSEELAAKSAMRAVSPPALQPAVPTLLSGAWSAHAVAAPAKPRVLLQTDFPSLSAPSVAALSPASQAPSARPVQQTSQSRTVTAKDQDPALQGKKGRKGAPVDPNMLGFSISSRPASLNAAE